MGTCIVQGTGSGSKKTKSVPDGYVEIRTVAELSAIRNNLSGNYILMADIDLTGQTSWTAINFFTGVLDGNGHAFKNRNSGSGTIFSNATALIKNIVLDNCDPTSIFHIGSSAARLLNVCIVNCILTNSIASSAKTILQNVYVEAGVVVASWYGPIFLFISSAGGSITGCVANISTSGVTYSDRIVYSNIDNNIVLHGNLALNTMLPNSTNANGKGGKDTSETALKNEATYRSIGWDMDNVWQMDKVTGYPRLRKGITA